MLNSSTDVLAFPLVLLGMVFQVVSAVFFVRHRITLKKYTKDQFLDENLKNTFNDYIDQINKEQLNITIGLSVLLVGFAISGLGLILQQIETFQLVGDVWKEIAELKELLTSKGIIP